MSNLRDIGPLFDNLVYEVHHLLQCQLALDNTSRLSYEWDRKNLDEAHYNYDATVRAIRAILKEYRL